MKKIFTIEEGMKNRGCYLLIQALRLSFAQGDAFTVEQLVQSEIPLKDKFWYVLKKCQLTRKEKVEIAINAAEIVLPIIEAVNPSNNSVRECIEATKLFIGGHITVHQLSVKTQYVYPVSAAYDAAMAAMSTAGLDIHYYGAVANAVDEAYDYDSHPFNNNDEYETKLENYLLNFINTH